MLEMAADYVKDTITRLPNFIATRETTHFEDTPSVQTPVASAPLMVGRMGRSTMRAPGAFDEQHRIQIAAQHWHFKHYGHLSGWQRSARTRMQGTAKTKTSRRKG
jgi:hypothetical protein